MNDVDTPTSFAPLSANHMPGSDAQACGERTPAPRLRVLLADDHTILRQGLALMVAAESDMEVVAQARGGHEAVQMAREYLPDVVVLDISMPDLSGAEAAQQIHAEAPSVRMLALTRHVNQGYLRRMLQAGASGYVTKRAAGETLIGAIRTVCEGGSYIDPGLASALLMSSMGRQAADDDALKVGPHLSQREEQVLRLIAWGKSNKEVAHELAISIKTAEFYKASATAKLGLRSRTEIVRYALAARWLADLEAPE